MIELSKIRIDGGNAFHNPTGDCPIEVAATMIGGYDEERSLHKRFAAIRAHGEWFHAAPTLLEFIGSIGAEA